MDIVFEKEYLNTCKEAFLDLPPDQALFSTHYELAVLTNVGSPEEWREFLSDSRVREWIQAETEIMRQVNLRKVMRKAADNDRSVGTAQMLNALSKAGEDSQNKEGNIFIYSYVPLNERELSAPNVNIAGGE